MDNAKLTLANEEMALPSFARLVDQVMAQTPCKEARRVFWILDNGSAHRGSRCIQRLQAKYPTIVPVQRPCMPVG